jgi:hypothetical protein
VTEANNDKKSSAAELSNYDLLGQFSQNLPCPNFEMCATMFFVVESSGNTP